MTNPGKEADIKLQALTRTARNTRPQRGDEERSSAPNSVDLKSAKLELRLKPQDNLWPLPRGINMAVSSWTEADSSRAQAIWSDYEHHHDLSEKTGLTAGIDPASGRIWFGRSIQDVVARRDAAGSEAPLFFVRVGSATYYRKGGHR